MTHSPDIARVLRKHETRLARLEVLFNKMPSNSRSAVTDKKKNLADHIVAIRDSGFFSQPKIAEEVHKKINEKYLCELNRVAVALLRLARRRELRRATKTINEKKYQAYGS